MATAPINVSRNDARCRAGAAGLFSWVYDDQGFKAMRKSLLAIVMIVVWAQAGRGSAQDAPLTYAKCVDVAHGVSEIARLRDNGVEIGETVTRLVSAAQRANHPAWTERKSRAFVVKVYSDPAPAVVQKDRIMEECERDFPDAN